jgi:uncharacterized protein (TIGR02266 family)
MTNDKRRHPRAALTLLVQFKFQNFEDFAQSFSRDLSESGVFIETPTPRQAGSTVFVQVLLQNGARLVECMANVVRVEDGKGMALQFASMDDASRQVIRDLVNRQQDGATKPDG